MEPSTFEKAIRFGTDAYGLERTLRLFQSLAHIFSTIPIAFEALEYIIIVSNATPPPSPLLEVILLALRQRLGLARRFLRMFRFLDTFNRANKLYASLTPTTATGKAKPTWVQSEAWLELLGCTFNGMYLLLETSTLINALQIDGFTVWTPEWNVFVDVEAQRFWLFANVCAVLGGLLSMLKVLAYTPVPSTGEGFSQRQKPETVAAAAEDGEKDQAAKPKDAQPENGDWDLRKEQLRLRNIVKDRKRGRGMWRKDVKAKLRKLGRETVANAIDILLPGSIVGWVNVSPGTVGLAMFVTTILTSMSVWERCGRELAAAAA